MCDWLPKLDDTAIVAVLQSAHESLSMVDHVKKNCYRSKMFYVKTMYLNGALINKPRFQMNINCCWVSDLDLLCAVLLCVRARSRRTEASPMQYFFFYPIPICITQEIQI